MHRWTALVLAHRRLVVLAWLVLAAVGAVLAPRTVEALSYSFALPEQAAYLDNQAIVAASGGGGVSEPLVLVATGPTDDADVAPALAQATERVAAAVPGTRVVAPTASAALRGRDATAVALLYPPVTPGPEPYVAALPRVEAAVEQVNAAGGVGGGDLAVSGATVLADSSSGSERSVVYETVLGGADTTRACLVDLRRWW